MAARTPSFSPFIFAPEISEMTKSFESKWLAQKNVVLPGAIAGAVTAALLMLGSSLFSTPVEPRLDSLMQQVALLETRLSNQDVAFREMEVGLTSAIESGNKAQEQRLGELLARVDQTERELRTYALPGSPVFELVVRDLTNAVNAGRSFKAEWVNLYALIVDGAPDLQRALQELMPAAHMGIDTLDDLTIQLERYRTDMFFDGGLVKKTWVGTLYPLQRKLGFPMVLSPKDQIALSQVDQMIDHLKESNLGKAMGVASDLGNNYLEKLEPWMALAIRHQTAQEVLDRLANLSEKGLSTRLRRIQQS